LDRNPSDANGHSKTSLDLMEMLKSTRQGWLQKDIPKLREYNLVIYFP